MWTGFSWRSSTWVPSRIPAGGGDTVSKKAVVTGAAGFIGSHLCERLLREGYRVTGIDCFTDYYDPARKREHIRFLLGDQRFNLVEENINTCDLRGLLDGAESVFHLAAQAGVRRSWGSEFTHYLDSNILATQRLLEAMRGREGIRLIYSSSSSVYGETRELPMREDHRLRPLSPYGATKLSGEHLCELYHANFGLSYAALRYFTVYGPRQRPDMAFSRFITAAFRGDTIEIYGDGKQTRDFTFVSDAVEANCLAARYAGSERIFNIGGGSRVSVLKVLDILRGQTGRELRIEFTERARGDVLDTWADTSRARTELGFSPSISLEEGMGREIDWYRERLGDSSGR
ncbi:MAG: NAD-dependent epimerase/dehydratase family protein [Candidatus Krumholzibacteriota bacterium]|nr:NAD-dependent epimerase/dehydratase family protein [Candidatus Krumholzibacteriota bacterium]